MANETAERIPLWAASTYREKKKIRDKEIVEEQKELKEYLEQNRQDAINEIKKIQKIEKFKLILIEEVSHELRFSSDDMVAGYREYLKKEKYKSIDEVMNKFI
jgi:hypothetical protein